MANIRNVGDMLVSDFFNNTGGMNTADSPFSVLETQATGGQNYEYAQTGGITKKRGATLINSSADTRLYTLGLGQQVTTNNSKTLIRAADKKIQNVDPSIPSFTNLSEDTVTAGTDFFATNSTQPVVMNQFTTTVAPTLWMAGGGLTNLYGAYNSTKVTANGSVAPASGTIGLSAGSSGGTIPTGTYFYSVALRKAGTQAISNAALDVSVGVTIGQKVTITLSSITGVDTTKYDRFLVYRSAAAGVSGFTTGDLIFTTSTATASVLDDGSIIGTASAIPRAGSASLDNSVLPTGTFNTLAVWKRRLVTASGSTLYLSDLNKPESWPTVNVVTIPSGGPITGMGIISFFTPTTSSVDEFLAIFKESELWVFTGTSASDWALKFVDGVGCPNQPLIVSAGGHLSWIDYRGIYLWDGSDKPIYCSRPIEDKFDDLEGTIDKSKLNLGWGTYYRYKHSIVWVISDTVNGENLLSIKMDLRLTLPNVQASLNGRVVDAVLIPDVMTFKTYAGVALRPATNQEALYTGDSAGHIYTLFSAYNDAGAAIDFQYETKYFDLGTPGVNKRFYAVIVWTQNVGQATFNLDYWPDYLAGTQDALSTSSQTLPSGSEALWDFATWDSSYWDALIRTYTPLIFYLTNAEGPALKLRFRQQDSNAPCVIMGFSVMYSDTGIMKEVA